MKRNFCFWELHEVDGLAYLDFARWPGVRVLYSTRVGGISYPPFDSLNLHYGRGDKKQHVRENRQKFFHVVEVDEQRIVFTKQTHSETINIIRSCSDAPQGDGMITDQRQLFLGIFTADCLGVFLFAPHVHVIGAIHAGRKGLAAAVIESGVRALCDTYRVKPGCIEAICGPSIGPCCYEIGEELRHTFASTYIKERMNRIYLDLWSIAADQLAGAGVRKTYIPHICTATHSDLFFSYRKSGEKVGENLGLIGMAPR